MSKARVKIDLPDGTHVDAEGPLAEEMARRMLQPAVAPLYVPYWPSWPSWQPYVTWTVGAGSNTSSSTYSLTGGTAGS